MQTNFEEVELSEFDIIQAPKWMKREDLPSKIKLNEPFIVNGDKFMLLKMNPRELSICCKDASNDLTSLPSQAKNYYTIKRIE